MIQKISDQNQRDLFQALLKDFIDLSHPLVVEMVVQTHNSGHYHIELVRFD